MSFSRWATQYRVDDLINGVRNRLQESDFISTIKNIIRARGQTDLVDYSRMTANELSKILDRGNLDNLLNYYTLYFVIDIVNLKFNFGNPKLEIIDNFYPIAKLSIEDCNVISAAWMLENGYPVHECLTKITKMVPADLRIYFLRQIINRNGFHEAYEFYKSCNIPLPYSSDGKLIVTCLTADEKLNEAIEFIHQYCSPNGTHFLDTHTDYIEELCRVAKILHFEKEIEHLPLNLQEKLIVQKYIGPQTSTANIGSFEDNDDNDDFDDDDFD